MVQRPANETDPLLAPQPLASSSSILGETTEEQWKKFREEFFNIFKLGTLLGGSYTFSFYVAILTAFYRILSKNLDDPKYAEAAPLVASFLFLVAMTLFNIGYSGTITTSDHLSKIKSDALDEEEKNISIKYITGNLGNTAVLSTIACAIGSVPLIFSEKILVGFGQDPEVAKIAADFLKYYPFALWVVLLRGDAEGQLSSFNHPWAIFISAFANFLVFGVGGSLLLGIEQQMASKGFVISTTLAEFFTLAYYLWRLARHVDFKEYPFLSVFFTSINWKQLKELFNISLPLLVTSFSEVSIPLVLSTMAGFLENEMQVQDALLIWSFPAQLLYWTIVFIFAISTATYIRANLNKTNNIDVVSTVRAGLTTNIFFMAFLCLIPLIYPEILKITSPDVISDESMWYAKLLVYLMIPGVILDAVRWTFIQVLRGSFKDFWASSFASIFSMWAGVALGCCMAVFMPNQLISPDSSLRVVFLGVGWLVGVLLSCIFLFPKWRENIKHLLNGGALPEETESLLDYLKSMVNKMSSLVYLSNDNSSDWGRLRSFTGGSNASGPNLHTPNLDAENDVSVYSFCGLCPRPVRREPGHSIA